MCTCEHGQRILKAQNLHSNNSLIPFFVVCWNNSTGFSFLEQVVQFLRSFSLDSQKSGNSTALKCVTFDFEKEYSVVKKADSRIKLPRLNP